MEFPVGFSSYQHNFPMDDAWQLVKYYSMPMLLGPVKYQDMSKDMKNAAINDAIARVILIALAPFLISCIIPFIIAVQYGFWIHSLFIWMFGQRDETSLVFRIRQHTVLITGSLIFIFSIFFHMNHLAIPCYKFITALF